MNKIELEIYNLSLYSPGSVKHIGYLFAEGFLIKSTNEYQVAIRFDKEGDYTDEFVGIKLNTGELCYCGETMKVLYLHVSDKINIDNFVPVAEQFLEYKYRHQILNDPYKWIDEWRQLFGDSILHKSVSDIVAEMVAFRAIRKIDPTVKWVGLEGESQDIVGKDQLYEVKSTTNKKTRVVFVNSAIQLIGEKKESLIFVRLECKPYGETIDSIEEELIKDGVSKDEIEENLSKKGLMPGSKYRKIGYDIIEIASYDVTDELFPLITLEQLNKSAPKNNIIDYQLKLSLDGLPCTMLFAKE